MTTHPTITVLKRSLTNTVSTLVLATTLISGSALASDTSQDQMEMILKRLEKLEAENKALKAKVNAMTEVAPVAVASTSQSQSASSGTQPNTAQASSDAALVTKASLAYDMLDATTNINRKQLRLLEAKQTGELANNSVVISGGATAIMDYWRSNTDDKFGYLMRHPTPSNQRQKTVSEAVLHSMQLSATATVGDWVTVYGEALYDPEQSFGQGTITDLNRNQLQLRKGYVLLGNLDKSPLYLTVGKMATSFGLTDTVSPFTASTVWHAFGGLAFGALAGYSKDGLNITAELVQGGAQFRSANMPNDGTNVPSKLNNYVLDANYTLPTHFGSAMVGASYQRGSAYCQSYPVTHFNPCEDNNPAYSVYGQLFAGDFMFLGEFAKTTRIWDGTHNPTPPLDQFEARKVTSFGLGGRYSMDLSGKRADLSLEFSSFIAGPKGSPWRRQDQTVLGFSYFLTDSVKFFGEGIFVNGYAPLNFISGGNVPPGETHSDMDITNKGVIIGVNAVF
ncbi:hypothetical protein GCM10017044_20930 [Kordiimonas sediminis]|uniref:Porin n=1 Tax=Kordiimonas sediminis TaxID=1735581 RepID=A0A919AT86_9PROT|nr:hypothetical protein [Kordiimonas sediminis]GHF25903.1 hypothetical protein GCM10017044_20930 [Kordiimonas sediminis]